MKVACARTYGTAGPELVRLIAERFESASAVRQYVRDQVTAVSAALADQSIPAETARAVRRFALIAVAGEFAAHAGLIPVEASEVRAAVKGVVSAWLGASSDTDEERIVASVRAFILRHESRFQRINEPDPEPKTDRHGNEYQPTARDPDPVRDRAGYVDRKAGKWMFTPDGLKEAAPGNDVVSVARTLKKSGYLFTNSGKQTTPVPIEGSRPRLYVVLSAIIEDGEAENSQDLSKTGVQGVQGVQAQQPQGFEAAHPATHPGVQGVQGAMNTPDVQDAAHPAHPHTMAGVRAETRAVTGAAHLAHPTHQKNSEGEIFSVDDNGEVTV